MLTGDKRSLIALADAPTLAGLRAALSGRVMCLEQALERVVARIGLPTVLASVDRSPIGDTAIRAVFGPPRTPESVGEGLRSYVRHLREQTGTLLVQ